MWSADCHTLGVQFAIFPDCPKLIGGNAPCAHAGVKYSTSPPTNTVLSRVNRCGVSN